MSMLLVDHLVLMGTEWKGLKKSLAKTSENPQRLTNIPDSSVHTDQWAVENHPRTAAVALVGSVPICLHTTISVIPPQNTSAYCRIYTLLCNAVITICQHLLWQDDNDVLQNIVNNAETGFVLQCIMLEKWQKSQQLDSLMCCAHPNSSISKKKKKELESEYKAGGANLKKKKKKN